MLYDNILEMDFLRGCRQRRHVRCVWGASLVERVKDLDENTVVFIDEKGAMRAEVEALKKFV